MQCKIQCKSMQVNMLLNAIKGLMGVVFPLISFPYVTKVLGVDNVGKYNFSNSIIDYFFLVSGLGIATYAIREGAKIRGNKGELNKLANEVFSINIVSTIFAYILLIWLIIASCKLREYKVMLIILSLQIIFKTIGVDWIYAIYEDFAYMTIRSITFQIISIALLFLLVKERGDIYTYATITVISSAGSNILNYVHSKKYCSLRFTLCIEWKKHIKPILVLFATTVTVTIYVSSDTTILGLICGDYIVGIYSVSTKIYTILKTILSSILIVSIPCFSILLEGNKRDAYEKVASDICSALITFTMPAIVGIFLLRKEIILIVSNQEYMEATSSLVILSTALIPCLGAWFWSQCILIPIKLEREVFIATIISAAVNIVLNIIMIPYYKENAAALTTFLAEGITFIWCWMKGKTYIKVSGLCESIYKSCIGCVCIIGIYILIGRIICDIMLKSIIVFTVSVVVYLFVECIIQNSSIINTVKSIKRKFWRNK